MDLDKFTCSSFRGARPAHRLLIVEYTRLGEGTSETADLGHLHAGQMERFHPRPPITYQHFVLEDAMPFSGRISRIGRRRR